MMKVLKAIIFAIYVVDYIYAAYMTSVKPDETYWGYICTGIFAYLFIAMVSFIQKKSEKSENTQENL